jgi:hypothetical protein
MAEAFAEKVWVVEHFGGAVAEVAGVTPDAQPLIVELVRARFGAIQWLV